MGWGQPHAPAASNPGKDPVPIVKEARWASRPVWTGGKSRPHRDSIPDSPARSQSPYRLSYPALQFVKEYTKLTSKNELDFNMRTDEHSTSTNNTFRSIFLLLISPHNFLFWYVSLTAHNARRFDMVLDSTSLWWCCNKDTKHLKCNNWFPVPYLYTENKNTV